VVTLRGMFAPYSGVFLETALPPEVPPPSAARLRLQERTGIVRWPILFIAFSGVTP